jgi:hypothetical protein
MRVEARFPFRDWIEPGSSVGLPLPGDRSARETAVVEPTRYTLAELTESLIR